MAKFKLVYIAHPYSDNPDENLRLALAWVRFAAKQPSIVPIAPWIEYVQTLDNENVREKELGMRLNFAVLERCDEIWLCGPYMSEGMRREEAVAVSVQCHVVDKYLGLEEPPV